MRCQFGDSGEMGPPAYNIWTSGSLQTPNILKNMTKPNDTTHNGSQNNIFTSCTAMLSTSYTTDSGSPSQKRKMLDSENEDFEERFSKNAKKETTTKGCCCQSKFSCC
ncbi:hypothetical protein CEXT_610841 [Caerostris extrusa]|uniref:Uncharacterized protein n=1 Tax=Caerostris extrusa TaxID=172846 RepID=A0AAV4QHB7_CAEEX|nr:hypothetical protein CEXT_610841 [Caerostris extrusa]